MSSLSQKFNSVVNKMNFSSEVEKECFESRLLKYIKNDSNKCNQEKILEIVSNIKWFDSKEINDFIVKNIKRIIDEDTAIIQFKPKLTSSSNVMISFISSQGLCMDSQIISLNDVKNSLGSKYSQIVFIDDYIGSGDTIISAIKDVEGSLKDKKVVIISYICQTTALSRFDELKGVNYDIIAKHYLESFREYLDLAEKEYAEDICELCPDLNLKFGWGNTGSMISINHLSPNNNISMLWCSNIKYNGRKWLPLLNRELSFEMWNAKNKRMINKSTMLLKKQYSEWFQNRYFRYNLSYNEFEFLVYTYSCYLTPEELIQNGYFSDESEFYSFIENMVNNDLIELKNNYIIISNESLYCDISRVDKLIYRNNNSFKKNINNTIDV